jgi:hypothetical protein
MIMLVVKDTFFCMVSFKLIFIRKYVYKLCIYFYLILFKINTTFDYVRYLVEPRVFSNLCECIPFKGIST